MEFKLGDKVAFNTVNGIREGIVTNILPIKYQVTLEDGRVTICEGCCLTPVDQHRYETRSSTHTTVRETVHPAGMGARGC